MTAPQPKEQMSNPVSEPREAYYREARSWGSDRERALEQSRRVAWIVALCAVAAAVGLAIAIAFMLPLKTVVPYTLLVDRQTGYVQALDPLRPDKVSPDTALTQSLLAQYVMAREGFDHATVQTDYRKAVLMSSETARSAYVSAMQVSNPNSPLVTLPRGSGIDVRVKSVSSLGQSTALVRFDVTRRDRSGSRSEPQPWVAVLTYRYATTPMSVEDRYVNPLGFEVVQYRKNREAAPVAETAGSSALTNASAAGPAS